MPLRAFPVPDMTDAPDADHEMILPGDAADVRGWIRAAQAGDRAAFDALVERHQRTVLRTAMAALQRREDAEDVAQEAFVLAWRKIGAFRGESTFKTWLLTITWRQALDRRKSRDRWWKRQVASRDDDAGDVVERLMSPDVSPEHAAATRAELRAIRGAIARLTPKLRDTLLLASSGEYAYEEIAAMLGAPVGTIKWRVAEARRQLVEMGNEGMGQ
ncbi:MAG: DNA-directed RNA polymerase sigma-70 factor [Acidimicrobiia bacterium]